MSFNDISENKNENKKIAVCVNSAVVNVRQSLEKRCQSQSIDDKTPALCIDSKEGLQTPCESRWLCYTGECRILMEARSYRPNEIAMQPVHATFINVFVRR